MYKSVEDRQVYDGKTFTRYKGNWYYWWKVSSDVEARKKSGVDDVEKVCPICDNIYRTNKYRGRRTCSDTCASEAIRRARTKRK